MNFCSSLLATACLLPSVAKAIGKSTGQQVASGTMQEIADAIQSGIGWLVKNTVTWWVQVPSPDLTKEPAIDAMHQWLMPISLAVAVLSMLIASAKMAITRKANPLIDVGQGLMIIAASSALGVLLPTMLLKAGDAWSNWVLNASTGKDFDARMTAVLAMPNLNSAAVVVVLGVIVLVLAAVQAMLMLFRQASLIILAGVLPLAAAGSMTPKGREGTKKVTGWTFALVFYKPAGASVYAVVFVMIGDGKDARTIFMGVMGLGLAVAALPILTKFFTWGIGAVESSGGSGFLSAAIGGAVAVGSFRGSSGGSGGASAADQARFMDSNGPGGPNGPPSSSQPPPGGPDAGPSGDASGGGGVQLANTASASAPTGAASTPAASGTSGRAATAAGSAAGAAAATQQIVNAARNTASGSMTPNRRSRAMTQTSGPRTYGGWRRRRSIGLLGLGTTGTLILLGAAVIVVISAAISLTVLAYAAPPIIIVGGLSLIRVGGIPLGQVALQRLRWWRATARGYTSHRAGVVLQHPRAFQLPGVLASTALLSAEDGYGGRYGLVWDRHTGLLTATLRVVPASTWLADRADADSWVANWGAWLASLGHMPMIRWVSITVDTAPEPGSTLADTVTAALSPQAPPSAARIMQQLVDSAPGASADVDTRVSITFDPKASPAAPRGLTEAAAEVGRSLQGLESALGTCGVTVLGRASATEVAGIVRTAFDPHARGEVNRIVETARADPSQGERLGWDQAGDRGAKEFPDRYEHDGGISVSWAWDEAPRSNVHSDVLARLVAPTSFPKRVTVQYRPLPAASATRVLDTEVQAGAFRRHYRARTGRDETARDVHDEARARQAANEEAMGAGVGLLAMYVTATVTDLTQLPRAVADTEAAAEGSKIRLRRLWRSQSPGFATTLPCGICPAELASRWPH